MDDSDSIIHDAIGATQLRRCFPVISQLRPHLTESGFVEQVLRQQETDGYHLGCLESGGKIRALAGYRFMETLAWGKICYMDDLVTDSGTRSQGCGRRIFGWVAQKARERGCAQLHLDSGVQRFGAHRFYLTRRMEITCHHFAVAL